MAGKITALIGLLASSFCAISQRIYTPNSVLSTGSWYKLSIKDPGVYKIDIPFLNTLGISQSSIPSGSIRLFGNGGSMLSEANNGPWTDDLKENAIMISDGGDGMFNGSDFILFYAAGPDEWIKDSINQRFSHRKNIYSDRSYYFLSIGGTGKRIPDAAMVTSPTITVNSFSERVFHELDTVNFLGSGKEWYGEELSDLPGRTLSRNFSIPLPNISTNAPIILQTQCIARSVGSASRFDIKINDQLAGQLTINPISGGQYDLFAQQATGLLAGTGSGNTIGVAYTYFPGSFNAQGWINWFELFTRRNISLNSSGQLPFRDWVSVGNNIAEFIVTNSTNTTQVWDVTDPLSPVRMQGNLSGNEFRFVNSCNRLREYIAFNAASVPIPIVIGKIPNQDLHQVTATDMILVTHPTLLGQAQRLAQLHQQQNNLRTLVVTTEQVYQEFGSGSPDPVAIRDLVKMYYDRYSSNPANRPKYLLLFGDASYDFKDRITGNTNMVPAYENNFSLDPLSTYTSDDFFGFLDDNDDINSGLVLNLLDIGIGRIPAKNSIEAKNFVDKLAEYISPKSLGPWRNTMTFLADDEDNNLHLQDAEIITATASVTAPVFNLDKIYLDAFRQESGPGGSSYPGAIQASNNQVYNGTLIWNFNGHGGSGRLAEETILDQSMVNNWNNAGKLPLFITATCDVAPYDNPGINSIGENILLRPQTGGIALMTTTRPVFAFSNRIMNDNYIRFALETNPGGSYRTLGDAVKDAKNFTYQSSGDISNNRKFTLLGDPALTIAYPAFRIRTTKINNIPAAQADTLSSTEKVMVEGEVTDIQGNLLGNFNGAVYPVVYDKAQSITTLANDPGSQPTAFASLSNIVFKGKATVTNGKFQFQFKMPKDINYNYGNGKLSLYAENGTTDANGYFNNFIVGGAGTNAGTDITGPRVRLFLNDEKFVNGGITNQHPILIAKLSDTSGINTAGTGIDHDIVATLDNDNRNYFILNNFYQGDLDSYQQGSVRFQLPELTPGPHTIKVKAWDVLNNSGEALLEFTVAKDEKLEISHVLNYPNPFSTNTQFWFEHNKPGQPLKVSVTIMTITGRVIKTISTQIMTEGNRSAIGIEWDGNDDYGNRLGRGVYLYKLRVIAGNNDKKEVIEKLVIL